MTETTTPPTMTEKASAQTVSNSMGTQPNGQTQSKAATNGRGQYRLSSEQKQMVYQLQDHIYKEGRYADALNPIAMGYAAGKGIEIKEAKEEINASFEKELGAGLKLYLEQYRQNRGMSVDNGIGGRS